MLKINWQENEQIVMDIFFGKKMKRCYEIIFKEVEIHTFDSFKPGLPANIYS